MKDIMSLYGNGYEYRVLIGRKDEPTENPHAVLLGCVSVAELIDGKWMSINDDEMAECFGRYSEIIEPTHWMPLPEPPK
jgi:hypothetical protein